MLTTIPIFSLYNTSMASSLHLLLFSSLLCLTSLSHAISSYKTSSPSALVLPIRKDVPTHLYVAEIKKRTPQVSVPLVVDLNGQFLWVNCEHQYLSTTYRAPRCHSSQCSIANTHVCRTCSSSPRPGCNNNTCGLLPFNPRTHKSGPGELAEDVLTIHSTDGSNPGRIVTVPRFLFACAPAFLLQGNLPQGVQGFAGLGRTPIALPTQLASNFGFQHKFAICLGSTNGVIFFGGGPYMMHPEFDVSKELSRTSLIINQKGEYFIDVRSIKVNNKVVPLNTTLLSIDRHGYGGTKISTVVPHTVLETSIFKAVTQAFANELPSSVPRVAAVAPFELCFNSSSIIRSSLGPRVPPIDLGLQKNDRDWRILRSNVVAEVGDDLMCLAFVDGGLQPRASIVIGAHQLEDNLLQFDLTSSRLGFSSSLLFMRTTCGNFNFTSEP